MLLCFLAALSPVSPSEPPRPAGVPANAGRVPCVHAPPGRSRCSETDTRLVHPAFLGTRAGFCVCFLPSLQSQEDHPTCGCPSGPERRSRRDQRWKDRGTAASRASSGFLSWAGPGLCADGHGGTLPPLCFTSFSARLSLPVGTRGSDWLLCGVRKIGT